ncbi:MAG: hypothetical protein GAK35_03909 [Herbaspirillum frisingense]|uniref:Uncharacterized protein n=1 Tax=Herbaspirillum frisingense TaxID=92645 RepID=A0A7V8FTD4_9BURK|nr:MAG: hypothetical protein GAK35_03909 [Herbaspirillum frisingense]
MLYKQGSEFSTRRGRLYILDLEPGEHEITSWQVASGGARIVPQGKLASLKFELHAGQALYLGNLHARLLLGRSLWFGNGAAARDALPIVQDRSDEDIGLAESKVPALRGRVTTSLLPQGPWIASQPNVNRMDPVFIPVVPAK